MTSPTDLPVFPTGFGHTEDTAFVQHGADRFTDADALVDACPSLIDPANATLLAQVAIHFARGTAFRVVADRVAFESTYRAAIAAEDQSAPFRQAQPRRSDFGIPDFAATAAPHHDGDILVFTVEDRFTGVPYIARVDLIALDELDIAPIPLHPVPLADTTPVETGEAFSRSITDPDEIAPTDIATDDLLLKNVYAVVSDEAEADEPLRRRP